MSTTPAIVRRVGKQGYMQCASYALLGPSGVLLLDPGAGLPAAGVADDVRRLGVRLEDVELVLFTHCHADHAFWAHGLAERGIRLAASEATAAILEAGGPQMWCEHAEQLRGTPVARKLRDGDVIDAGGISISVVHTPGHTHGSMSYAVQEEDGLSVFTGDLVMYDGQPGWTGPEYSKDVTLQSLQRLASLGARRAYPGHDGCIEDPADWLTYAIELGRSGAWKIDASPKASRLPEELP